MGSLGEIAVLRHLQLLIFDLDYLTFDCATLKLRALRESLIPFAEAIPHDVRLPDSMDIEEAYRDHGRRWIWALQLGLPDEQLAQLHAEYEAHEQRLLDSGTGRPFPGLTEILSPCRQDGVVAAIGADASRDYLLAVSDRHNLHARFEFAFCTEEFGMGNTEEMIEEIMERAEVNPSETLMLATRPDFFRAARDRDVLTIGCGWALGRHDSLAEADIQAPTLSHLPRAIARADAQAAGTLR